MYRLLARLAWVFAVAGGGAAALVAAMVVVSIVMRATVSTPIQGDVELTQLGIAFCISLCLPWCQLHGSNIIVDFFTQRTSTRSQQVLDAIGGLLLAAMVWLLAWRTAVGAVAVAEANEATMIRELPMWWIYAALAPGLALTGVIAFWQAGLRLLGHDPVVKEIA